MQMLKMEVKRSLRSKGMLCSVFAGVLCILYKNIDYYIKLQKYYNLIPKGSVYEMLNRQTFYSLWIVGNFSTASTIYIFYFMGLLVTMPFGVSYYLDKKNGIIENICVRSGKKRYLMAKYAAVFISGGIAILIPLVLDFLFSKIWIPHDFVYMPFTILNTGNSWGIFVIDNLYISAIITMIAWFVFGGALATLSLLISVLANDFFTIQLTPFFVMLILIYVPNFLPANFQKYFPYYFLSIFGDSNPLTGIIISLFLSVITFITFNHQECKKDIL